MKNFDSLFGKSDATAKQLPNTMVSQEFGEVNVRTVGDQTQVILTISSRPALEGCRTGVALDASASMRDNYGLTFVWTISDKERKQLEQDFIAQGKLKVNTVDGILYSRFTPEAVAELVDKKIMKSRENKVEPLAQEFVAHLAEGLDSEGGSTVIYWACGKGDDIEHLGDYSAQEWRTVSYRGPEKKGFGGKTHLLPPVQYFSERFCDNPFGIYVIITDGRIDDLAAVKQFTIELAKQIENEQRRPLKFILIGVGDEIDEQQMIELDDLETGTEIDIWDHKIAANMRDLNDIFAEIVNENQIVAPSAAVYSEGNSLVKRFADGLPALVTFSMPANSKYFELEVYGNRIRQSVEWS